VLLERRVPEDAVELETDPGDERRREDQRQRRGEAEEREQRRHRQHRQGRNEQRTLGPVVKRDDSRDDHAGGLGGEDEPPGCGSAQVLLGDERPEDEEGADRVRVDERELDDRDAEPGPRPELTPALRQLAEELPLFGRLHARDSQHRDEQGAQEVGRAVERERPPGADRRDQDSREGDAGDEGRVPREAE